MSDPYAETDEWPTPSLAARPATHSPEQPAPGSTVTEDVEGAREARYAEAAGFALATSWVLDEQAHEALTRAVTRVVMAVADEEQAALRAEVERLREAWADHALANGGCVPKPAYDDLAAEVTAPRADGDRLVDLGRRARSAECRVAEMQHELRHWSDRAIASEDRLRKVAELADEWDEHNEGSEYWRVFGPQVVSVPFAVKSLRAVLAAPPAAPEAAALNCPVCGSGEEGDCLCDQAEAIARAQWVASGKDLTEGPWETVLAPIKSHLIVKALADVPAPVSSGEAAQVTPGTSTLRALFGEAGTGEAGEGR